METGPAIAFWFWGAGWLLGLMFLGGLAFRLGASSQEPNVRRGFFMAGVLITVLVIPVAAAFGSWGCVAEMKAEGSTRNAARVSFEFEKPRPCYNWCCSSALMYCSWPTPLDAFIGAKPGFPIWLPFFVVAMPVIWMARRRGYTQHQDD